MNGSKILGILIIIVIILSIGFVGYNTFTHQTKSDENFTQTTQILDESQLNQTLAQDDNSSIQTVNLNIKQKVGSVKIAFADNTSTIYNITSKNKNGTTTNVTANQNESHLDIDVESENAKNTIVLSNKYNYTINGDIVSGGFTTNLNNNSNVDTINVTLTAGGLNLRFNGGKLNTLNSRITTGGLNIYGQPNGQTTINSRIEIGGLNIQMDKAIADIFSSIDVGGINPGKYQHVSENEYKGTDFDSSDNKLIINNEIRLGGVNTQSF